MTWRSKGNRSSPSPPLPLTVTANDASRLTGDPNPILTGTVAGAVASDGIGGTYTTSATPSSPAGTYPIVAGIDDPRRRIGNYQPTLVNGMLDVNVGPAVSLTLTPKSGKAKVGVPKKYTVTALSPKGTSFDATNVSTLLIALASNGTANGATCTSGAGTCTATKVGRYRVAALYQPPAWWTVGAEATLRVTR